MLMPKKFVINKGKLNTKNFIKPNIKRGLMKGCGLLTFTDMISSLKS